MITFYKNDSGLIPAQNPNESCWINAVSPTREEIRYLLEDLKIPEAFYNDIEDIDERPRLETENGWNLIILRIPLRAMTKSYPLVRLLWDWFLTTMFLFPYVFNPTTCWKILCCIRSVKIAIASHYDLVLKLLLSSSVWYQKYLKHINQRIKLAESNLEKSIKNEELQALLQIEKCLVFFITSLKGNDILFHRIKNLKIKKQHLTPIWLKT